MPVVYSRNTNGTITLQTLMTNLHTNLLAAGWTQEYGTGSGNTNSTATWTAAQVYNASAGSVVYRMSGVLNNWRVRLEAIWGSSTGAGYYAVGLRITTAKAVNTITGVLTEPGGTYGHFISVGLGGLGFGTVFGNADSADNYIVSNENGFLVCFNGSSIGGFVLGVERSRDLDGTLLDDVVVYAMGGSGNQGLSMGFDGSYASCRRSWVSGEVTPQRLAYAQVVGGGALNTTTRPDGQGFPTGFYDVSNGFSGQLRLVQLWLVSDAPANNTFRDIFIDSGNKKYWTLTPNIAPSSHKLLIAME